MCRGPQLACLPFPSADGACSACSAGDTVAGGPVCTSLSSLASVVGGSCCCQCQHGPASQRWEVCAATPKLSPRGNLTDCPSVWQSECVGCSVVTGGQRAWTGVWWCPCIFVCHYLHMLLCEGIVSAHP